MKLLFLCVANSARSQMAEGIARHILGPEHAVYSAGSHPTQLNPLALRALQEVGIDITHQKSKGLDAVPLEEMDCIVTLCAEEACPFVPGNVKKIHWPLPDPAAAKGSEQDQMEAFRSVRDELFGWIRREILFVVAQDR